MTGKRKKVRNIGQRHRTQTKEREPLSLLELKETYASGFVILADVPPGSKGVVYEDLDGTEKRVFLEVFQAGLRKVSEELETRMGHHAWEEWRQRFIGASPQERGQMWKNGGEWNLADERGDVKS